MKRQDILCCVEVINYITFSLNIYLFLIIVSSFASYFLAFWLKNYDTVFEIMTWFESSSCSNHKNAAIIKIIS